MGEIADYMIEQMWNQPDFNPFDFKDDDIQPRQIDINYYHHKISYQALNSISEKLFAINYKIPTNKRIVQLEIPKKICREIDESKKTMLVHTEIFIKIFKQKQLDAKNGIGSF